MFSGSLESGGRFLTVQFCLSCPSGQSGIRFLTRSRNSSINMLCIYWYECVGISGVSLVELAQIKHAQREHLRGSLGEGTCCCDHQ
jgi:hypothetical protein